MMFSEEEALCVVDLLKEKSGVIQDALKKYNKGELTALVHQLQEKDKLVTALKEDTAAMKDRCKQLTQVKMCLYLRVILSESEVVKDFRSCLLFLIYLCNKFTPSESNFLLEFKWWKYHYFMVLYPLVKL